MYCDLADLRSFYDSRLGSITKRLLRQRVLRLWQDLHPEERILALGYPLPLLRPLTPLVKQVTCVMPAQQGILTWPREGPNQALLAYEDHLPFADCSFDRILVLHALENTELLRPMLRELWRVLGSQGRLMVIVPNRRGLWTARDHTPFGHGHPYSQRQIKSLLSDCFFTPLRFEAGLYMPPFKEGASFRAAQTWERLGARWWPRFAGVLVIEACKQLYAGTPLKKEHFAKERTRAKQTQVAVESTASPTLPRATAPRTSQTP